MQLDKLLGERQAKSGPLDLVRIVGAYLAKFLEYPWLVLHSNADAGVGDGDFHRTIGLPGRNSDTSSLWSELHRVGKQVEKNLFNLPLVTHEIPKALVNCNVTSRLMPCLVARSRTKVGACGWPRGDRT